jgi:subtilisin family serine protease
LQPDIAAPGSNIIAATIPIAGEKLAKYKFDTGTSMACPHASAVAAYVKSFHPQWSPAAIRSALMTTGMFV